MFQLTWREICIIIVAVSILLAAVFLAELLDKRMTKEESVTTTIDETSDIAVFGYSDYAQRIAEKLRSDEKSYQMLQKLFVKVVLIDVQSGKEYVVWERKGE